MLRDIEPATSTKFEQGRLVGQEQERVRIVQCFHDAVSSGMLAALFKIQVAKEILDSASLPEAGPVAQASEMLSEAIEKMDEVLEEKRKASSRCLAAANFGDAELPGSHATIAAG
jgi:signal transduction histidine kinase